MAATPAESPLDDRDRRLIGALQCDGRLTAEKAAAVLDMSTRTVRRRWTTLLASGAARVVGAPRPATGVGGILLRIKVLRGRVDAIAATLAAHEDIPLIDLSATGDEIVAVATGRPDAVNRVVAQQTAVASVAAQTVLHVYASAADWRLDALTEAERAALTTPATQPQRPLDATDRAILAALEPDGRAPAARLATQCGLPESTVRRRLAALADSGQLRTQVLLDHRRLGLAVNAILALRVDPGQLDRTGRRLAGHPAVHGAFATTGDANLQLSVRVPDLSRLYALIAGDLGGLGIASVDTVLLGKPIKN
ncbi:Lrp/AsnC family transcriptional regulator [Fodinicola acaciae]|uniref:Lrp/AsnC family transcriptional regulator n=1 Tax=Fodinicola acaciae TaxID=2681555 RepID=UPI0013D39A21|nr:Lrp/AsnC family transcriptional regulator [Fodinicola acaciae]